MYERHVLAGQRRVTCCVCGGEKARYSRLMKLIGTKEYNKLFELSIADLTRAIALDSGNAELYCCRGYVYYGKAGLDMIYDRKAKAALTPAIRIVPKCSTCWD